jgi:hypothetical protein
MAQVWLSFEEIQEVFRCDAADARRRVVANQWERRRCSDGLVRAQVPPTVAHDFFTMQRCGEPECGEPEAQPEPASDFEAAMETLCRIFAADNDAVAGQAEGRGDTQARSAA